MLAIARIYHALPDLFVVQILYPTGHDMAVCSDGMPLFGGGKQTPDRGRHGYTFAGPIRVASRLRIQIYARIGP
jgi:hypothetical protein